MEIGKEIAILRKKQGLTQEQLGQAVGVSAQAVSKWENGSTPDAELLPSLADTLGVTIDTLFGREYRKPEGTAESLCQALTGYLKSIPYGERMYELFRLLCSVFFRYPYFSDFDAFEQILAGMEIPMETCFAPPMVSTDSEPTWLRSAFSLDEGLQLGVPSKDCPFFLLLPEPEQGYLSNFASNDRYRKLFEVLSLPGALEVLIHFNRNKRRYYSSEAVARHTGIAGTQVRDVLERLAECRLVDCSELETEEAAQTVYILHQNLAFVPFLLLARWMCEREDAFILNWDVRKRPILTPPDEKKTER